MKTQSKTHLFLLAFFLTLCATNLNAQTILPDEVNIPGKKIFSPCISFDGKHIIFVAKANGATLVMTSKKGANGSWETPQPVEPVNSSFSKENIIESPSLNADGTLIHFSIRKRGVPGISYIYSLHKIEGVWDKPIKLSTAINETDRFQTDPSLSLDGKVLYFARLYDGSKVKAYKCAKIYMAKKENRVWQKAVLLPTPVNDGCDRSPRICADGKTLFISTVRDDENGMQIYFTKQLAKNVWIHPVPVDSVNSEFDEIFPSTDYMGEKMYFLRGQGKKKNRTEKVYSVDLPEKFRPLKMIYLHGKTTDLYSKKPLYSKIRVIDPNTSVILQEIQANEKTGEYRILFDSGKKYRVEYFRKGYSHIFYDFETTGKDMVADITKNVQLYSTVDLILNIYDKEIYEPLDSKIEILDKISGKKIKVLSTKIGQGRYKITLPIGKNYVIAASKPFYEPNSFDLNLSRTVQFDEFERDLELNVKKVDVDIAIINAATGQGVTVDIEITNLSTNERTLTTATTGANGKISVNLRDGNKYAISVNPRGYAFYNTVLDLEDESAETPSITAKLVPLTTLTKIELKDIIFEFNSADLDQRSFSELENVIKLMKKNPQIKMEIAAHTDDVGSQAYNVKLSGKRAKSVADYIVEQGIPISQLSSKGYGKAEPKYLPANTEENRTKNRRVELKIIEITD